MTIEEFNTKYAEYLGDGHYGLAIDDSDVIDFLDTKFQILKDITGFKYYQIKLKFGMPRVYMDNTPEGTEFAIEKEIKRILDEKRND